MLASGLTNSSFMAVDATDVYFTVLPFDGPAELRSVPKLGGPMKTIHVSPNGCAIAVDATHVYCAEYSLHGAIFAFDKGGFSPVMLAMGGDSPRGLVVDEESLFWVLENGENAARKMAKTGGPVVDLGPSGGLCWGAALDATRLYWGFQGVRSVAKDGGPVSVLATDPQSGLVSVAVDGTNVYWADADDGTVRAMPKDGGPTTVLASGQGDMRSIAVDTSFVYWASLHGGQVMRLPLP